MSFEDYAAQPFFSKLPEAYHTMLRSCTEWARGRYAGMQGRVFDGTASRPRRDLLLWVADAGVAGADEPAAAAANGGSVER
jgi:hypothetical protein